MNRRVVVTGCFDLLHSGHVAFLQEAATYGDLYVCIGSDENVHELKGRYPVYSEQERKYMIDSLRCVKECRVSGGWGIMDFLAEIDEIKPHVLVVNEDGNTPAKVELCKARGIEYRVLKRVPHGSLPSRSTTSLRTECMIPYRIDLAGGWLDQPFVAQHHPGSVLTIGLEPTMEFNDRSGMASSTRKKAVALWHTAIPHGEREQLAKMLFAYDNPPGTTVVSGSQDAIGIVFPGLNRLHYDGGYWPVAIESVYDEDILAWIEQHLFLVTLGPRSGDFDVLEGKNITAAGAKELADAAEECWNAILARDARSFGKQFERSFEAQIAMFPRMVDQEILAAMRAYRGAAYGWKLSGAGGGGYIILVSGNEIPGAIRIKIRRKEAA